MSSLSSISKQLSVLVALFALLGCNRGSAAPAPAVVYYIHAESKDNSSDSRMADYLRRHMQGRTPAHILTNNAANCDLEVTVHVGDDFGGDYAVKYEDGVCHLSASSERIMTWFLYQFIKHQGIVHGDLRVEDLPPDMFPLEDTVASFPFEYQDIYTPCNQNSDMTLLLGLDNLEADWALWGHQLSRVLGSNGDSNYGYQNMSPELFARSGGLSHPEQFCFSSEKLFDLTVQYIMEQYGDGTEYPNRFTISPNDNAIACECRDCQAAGNTKGNATPAVTRFVERLAARFPHHTFFIPAYLTTKKLPDHKLPSNVGVFLSAMDYPRACNSTQSPEAQAFFQELEAWKKITDRIYIWDYMCNFDDYLTPYPILYAMQERFREYRDRGVKGIFLNGSGYFYSTMQEAYTIFLSQLMINPDLDIPFMVRSYFGDVVPKMGDSCADAFLLLEDVARERGKALPLYGGIEDQLNSYLNEPLYREFYSRFISQDTEGMTQREKAIYEKTRQIASFSFLELSRFHGLDENGYLERTEEGWVVKPEVLGAVRDLGHITEEDDVYLLTGNEHSKMDHMDRINEAGVYIADYENECDAWLKSQPWNGDLLLGQTLTLHTKDGVMTTGRLTDGVVGISQSYHWGWLVVPQDGLVIDIPADQIKDATEISIGFLNYERHRMAPPSEVSLWADGKQVKTLRRESSTDSYDEGERVVFQSKVTIPDAKRFEIRFTSSKRVDNVAIDEILAR